MFIEITAGLLTLYSVFTVPANTSPISTVKTVHEEVKEVITEPIGREALENIVREYFAETPILAEIARCESTFRHETLLGKALRGVANSSDVGLMQINEYYHLDKSKSLGYDIHSLLGNMAYAKYLYDKEGVKPWMSSSKCWKGALESMELAAK